VLHISPVLTSSGLRAMMRRWQKWQTLVLPDQLLRARNNARTVVVTLLTLAWPAALRTAPRG